MAESITVGYRQLGPGYYHKFIVYTDGNGNRWATSGWAGKDSSVKFSDFSQSGSSGSGSSGSDFGSIITTGGTSNPRKYDSNYPDNPKNPDGTDKYPGKDIKWEIVKAGDNLSGDWKKITDAMDEIAGEKHQYRPLDQNSNTTADEALRRAGIPEPKGDGFGGNWAPGSENNLPGGSDDAAGGAAGSGATAPSGGGAGGISGGMGAAGGIGSAGGNAGASGTTLPRRDPLVLDLDGDGIETTSTSDGTVILFDHDGDGVKTGTGWVKPDDGWLVLDRNGNGAIDSGRELFGVDTLKSNGQLATDGFDALKDLDINQDGKIDSNDSVFANLRIWRDLNQDGISQANELTTLAANNITEISVNSNAVRNDLGNGNVQTAAGTFKRSDGTTGTTGETDGAAANLDLLVNTFYRQFTDHITLTDQAKELPDLRGSGRVRDLSEAISLSTDLGNWVETYAQQTTRQGQIDKLDGFIEKWANTSDMKSLKAQADVLSNSGVKLTYSLAGLIAGTSAYDDFVRKLGVVERFMGFTYGGANGQALFTPLDATSGNLTVALTTEQIASISLAYDRFRTDIYESLLLQTRLKDYYGNIVVTTLHGTPTFSFKAVEQLFTQTIQIDTQRGMVDLIEFMSAFGEVKLNQLGWNDTNFLATQLNANPDLGAFNEELSSWTVHFATSTEHTLTGTSRADLLVGTAGADYLYGNDGDDTLIGGAGNDVLNGGYGNNTYLFGRGDGQDIIDSFDPTIGKFNTIELKTGISQSDVSVLRANDGSLNLILSIKDSNDTITMTNFFKPWSGDGYKIEQIKFADGTSWNSQAILTQTLIGNDTDNIIIGYDTDDTLDGGKGNDALNGGYGNNTYLFGRGDGQDTINSYDPTPGKFNTIQLKVGISQNDVSLLRSSDSGGRDLIVSINNTNDTITVANFFRPETGDSYKVEQIRFADGTSWDNKAILTQALVGNDGDNVINGYDGDDTLDGGKGNDVLNGGSGNNTYLFGRGDGQDIINSYDPTPGKFNTLQLKAGISQSDVSLMRSTIGNAMDLVLSIKNTSDKITVTNFFLDSNAYRIEQIKFADGTSWNNQAILAQILIGNDADNTIIGYDSDDTLDGGKGNDVLNGGYGNNTYLFGRGDGQDTIDSFDPTPGKFNTIQLKAGITQSDVSLMRSDNASGINLILSIKDSSDQITIAGFFRPGFGDSYKVEQIKFADGSSWNSQAILAQTLIGNDADNIIVGYDSDDVLFGLDGNDLLDGGNGNDTLDGGKGNDVLNGGYGNNTYLFGRGDGQDTIDSFDPTLGKFNTIQLKAGINQSDVSLVRSDNANGINLILSIKDTSDKITIAGFFRPGFGDSYKVEQIKFADGTLWNIEARLLLGDGPVLTNAISDQSVNKGVLFKYVIPDTVFTDTNSNDVLSYSATLADGKALPGWLKFNAATHTLSGTPAYGDVGVTSVKIIVTNLAGVQASDVFDLTVVNVNNAPVLTAPLAARIVRQNQVFNYTLPSNTFTDIDVGDKLTYSATLSTGKALPAWLKFDAATRTFFGTPANGDVGVLNIKLTAKDSTGAGANGTFSLTVLNVNDAPVLAKTLSDRKINKNTTFNYTLPSNTFTDIDVGDKLTYSATLSNGKPLPSWLKFNAATGTFSGKATSTGKITVRVTATDLAGATVHDDFVVNVIKSISSIVQSIISPIFKRASEVSVATTEVTPEPQAEITPLNAWDLSAALLDFHLTSSDTAALGGEVTAYGQTDSTSLQPMQALLASTESIRLDQKGVSSSGKNLLSGL